MPSPKEKNSHPQSPSIANKKAKYNYVFLEKLEAGVVLVGTEVKSLRQGKASLDEAFARIRSGELFLLGCNIAAYPNAGITNHEPLRVRKLLVHRRELKKIESRISQKGLTLIPLQIYFNRGLAKVELALAQGKTHGDKRETLKKRQADREMNKIMRRRF
jgi:SsrA-binding protein